MKVVAYVLAGVIGSSLAVLGMLGWYVAVETGNVPPGTPPGYRD